MRLQPQEINAIRKVVRSFDDDAKVYLFGSRSDDAACSGDIDLLVVRTQLIFWHVASQKNGIFKTIGTSDKLP